MTDIFKHPKPILSLVEMLRHEIEEKHKSLSISNEQLVSKVKEIITESGIDLATQQVSSDYLQAVVRDAAWHEANAEESSEIIRRLKSGDQKFAEKFFYGTPPKYNDCIIEPLRKKIIYDIKKTYNVTLTSREFSSLLYLYLWDNGTWHVLDKYSCRGGFFNWLERVARREIGHYVVKVSLMKNECCRTAGNTRLLGKSVDPELWEYVISDIMPDGQYKQLLLATLVERMTEAQVAEKFKLDTDSLRTVQKLAEKDFKNRLLRSSSGYEELVLRDNSPRIIELSDDFTMDFCAWCGEKVEASPFANVFGINPNGYDVQNSIEEFLCKLPDMLNWSEQDRLVWTLRAIKNASPVEVAECVGRDRSWVDTRFSRLNARFNEIIKKWWNRNVK